MTTIQNLPANGQSHHSPRATIVNNQSVPSPKQMCLAEKIAGTTLPLIEADHQLKSDKSPHQSLKLSSTEDDLNLRLRQELASIRYLTSRQEFSFGSGLDLNLSSDRPSLINLFTGNIKLSTGPPTTLIVAPPSSGEESEEEIFDLQQKIDLRAEEKNHPLFKEVVEILIDSQYIQYVSSLSDIPSGLTPSIILTNIDQIHTAKSIKQRMDLLITHTYFQEKLDIGLVRIMTYQNIPGCITNRIAIFEYKSKDQVVKLYNHLQEHSQILINSSQQPMKIYYGYDKRRILEEKWVGVVLRNLPPDCSQDMMRKNFSNTDKVKILSADAPQIIKGQKCAIVRVEDIEQAELFCKKWNNFNFNQTKKLKAHIHPFSNTKRYDQAKSHHQFISRQAQKSSASKLSLLNQQPTFHTEKINERNFHNRIGSNPEQLPINHGNSLETLVKSLQTIVEQQPTRQQIEQIQTRPTPPTHEQVRIPDKLTALPPQRMMKAPELSQAQEEIKTKEVCLQKFSQEFEIEQQQRKASHTQDQKVEQTVPPQQIQNANKPSDLAQSFLPELLPPATTNTIESLFGDRLLQKPKEQVQPKISQNDYLETILSGISHKQIQQKVQKKQQKSEQKQQDGQKRAVKSLVLEPKITQQQTKPPQKLEEEINISLQDVLKPNKKVSLQQPSTSENQGVDTKESSEEKLLGKRKQAEDAPKLEDKIQRGRKRKVISDSSEDESQSYDNKDDNSDDSIDSSYANSKPKKLKKGNKSDDENQYDSNIKFASQKQPEVKKRGRPKKRPRGRKCSNISSSSNSTSSKAALVVAQQQQALVQKPDSVIQPTKRSRGRPPKKQPVFDFDSYKGEVQ